MNKEHGSHNHSSHLQIWFCEHCDNVHFKTSNITLDFSKPECLELSDAILGILKSDFSETDLKSVSNLQVENDDILLSQTIN